MMRWWLSVFLCLTQLVLAGCAWRWPLLPPSLAAGRGDLTILREPRGVDWSSQLITSRSLASQRQAFVEQQRAAYRALQAPVSPDDPDETQVSGKGQYNLQADWPGPFNGNWEVGGAPGIPVASFSAGANHVPNSPATGLAGDAANKYLYLLSQNGHFIRIKGDDPLNSPAALQLGESFSNTGITMSPRCSRAYVVSDAGNLYVINALGSPSMNVTASTAIGAGANYITPFLDPILSAHTDVFDVLFVPGNDGVIRKYEVSGGTPSVAGTYTVASSITANTNCDGCSAFSGLTFAAPCVAIGGRVLIGDTAGNFYDYDTNTSTGRTYGNLGTVGGIYTPPAVELYQSPQSGDVYLDTSDGNTFNSSNLGDTSPIFAFVNVMRDAGPVCAWVNLAERSVAFSEPLFVDDDAANTLVNDEIKGALVNYDHAASESSASASFSAAVALATLGSIPGGSAASQATPLIASTDGSSYNIRSFFRIDTNSLLPASATISAATAFLRTTATTATGTVTLPGFVQVGGWGANGSTAGFLRGTNTLWSAANITSANAPIFETNNRVDYATAPIGFGVSQDLEWLGMKALLPGPVRVGEVGFVMVNGENPAPHNTASAPDFQGLGDSAPPRLEVTYEVRSNIPAYPIETAPIIDASLERVFVYLSNYVFCVRYDDRASWVGANATARLNATYQATRMARSTGARENDGANEYVRNRTSLAPSFSSLANLYAISHGRSGAGFHVGISRILPDNSNFGVSDQAFDIDTSPDELLSTDASGTLVVGDTPIASPSGGRFMLIDPFSTRTAGGDLLFTLEGTGRVYRVGTE